MDNLISITVNVVTYNSAEYIIDTLESIKEQTYPNIILHISDDCSTDNTVETCNNWIRKNESRFEEVKIITSEINTGVSANFNRVWDICNTEWMKDIAGDDVLLPNCIQDYVEYINDNPEAIVIFSRVRPFQVKYGNKVWSKESWHDYSFFNLTNEEQYRYLINNGNNLPAPSCFYNIKRLRELGIQNDERIPLLEDYPKWVMCARKKIKFHFLDKHTVGYRQDSSSLSVGIFSPKFYKSNLLFYLYYYLDEIKRPEERDIIFNLMCEKAMQFYLPAYNDAINLRKSWEYRVGKAIFSPLYFCKKIARHIIYAFKSR